ncbi:hypothetical protein OROHE_012599 [Orobanche hederae]
MARGTVILAEFTEFSGNFIGIAAQCLQKLPTTNYKFTYKCDGHTFNYLVEDGFTSAMKFWICGDDFVIDEYSTVDPITRMILNKMHNRGEYSNINGCISTGKEANVYHATKSDVRNWLSKYTKLLFLYLSMSTNTSASFSDLMLLLCCTIFGGTYDGVWYDTVESYNLIINQWI